jgi:hypothetical protein
MRVDWRHAAACFGLADHNIAENSNDRYFRDPSGIFSSMNSARPSRLMRRCFVSLSGTRAVGRNQLSPRRRVMGAGLRGLDAAWTRSRSPRPEWPSSRAEENLRPRNEAEGLAAGSKPGAFLEGPAGAYRNRRRQVPQRAFLHTASLRLPQTS